jgi:hypothetical protein
MIELNIIEFLKVLCAIVVVLGILCGMALVLKWCIELWIKIFRAGKNAVKYVQNRPQFEAWLAYEEQRRASEGGQP